MILVLQIAAGIVLAFLIIRFRHTVWAVAVALIALAALVGVVVGGTTLVSSVDIPWGKILIVPVALLGMGLAGLGAFGFLSIFQFLLQTKRPHIEGDRWIPVFMVFGLANALVLTVIDAAWPTNPLSVWGTNLDSWSRANGWKDALSFLYGTAIMAAWPPIILFILAQTFKSQKKNIAQGGSEVPPIE